MTVNRQSYDPYAPFTASVAPAAPVEAPAPVAGTEDAREAAAQIPANLDDINKDDLIALAELAGVATYGTKQQLADRIRAAAGGD